MTASQQATTIEPATPGNPAAAPAFQVLSDPSLLRAITSFHGGISIALREFWTAHDTIPPPAQFTQTHVTRLLRRVARVGTPHHLELLRASRIYKKGRWRVPNFSRAVRAFVKNRRVDLLEWMVKNRVQLPRCKPGSLWIVAVENSEVGILELLRVHCPITLAQAQGIIPAVIVAKLERNPSFALVEWLGIHFPGLKLSDVLTRGAARYGNVEGLRCLLERELVVGCHELAFRDACRYGHCGVLDYLLERGNHPSLPVSVDLASCWSGVQALAFLHERGLATATTHAMDLAVWSRRWDVVQYLRTHRTEGGSRSAADAAAQDGNLTCLKLLLENRPDRCTTKAMDSAAAHGSIEMLRFLHEHSIDGCTTGAMDSAASCGYLNVVQFLHENRSEGCTAVALNKAALGGHLETVRFLCEHRTEGCTRFGIEAALRNHRVDAVQVIYNAFPNVFAGVQLLSDLLLYGALDVYLDMRKSYLDEEADLVRSVMVRAFCQHELRTIGFILNELGRTELIACVQDEVVANLNGGGNRMWQEAVERLTRPSSQVVDFLLHPIHPFLLDRRTPTWAVEGVLNPSSLRDYDLIRPVTWAQRAVDRRDPLLLEVLRDVPRSTVSSDGYSFSFAGARTIAIRMGERSMLEWLLTNIDEPIEPTLLGEALYYHRYDMAEYLVSNYPASCAEVDWSKGKSELVHLSWREFGLRDGLLLDWLEQHEAVRSVVSFNGIVDYAARKNDIVSLKRLYGWYPELLTSHPSLVELAKRKERSETMEFLREIGWSSDVSNGRADYEPCLRAFQDLCASTMLH